MGKPIKILAMDGGNGMNTGDLLLRLEQINNHNFLNQADIFVGTSAGGINSLFFAAAEHPADALHDIQNFWSDVNRSILAGLEAEEMAQKALAGVQESPLAPIMSEDFRDVAGGIIRTIIGLGQAAAGCRCLFLNDVLKKFLIKYFGEETTLAELKHYVIVVSFQLDNSSSGPDQTWVPKLFTNLPYTPPGARGAVKASASPDLAERVVDVALRTSAAPLELPIYQGSDGTGPGYVDGGLVANNPAMIALSAIAGTLAHGTTNQPPQPVSESLGEIYMLSVGTGRNLVGSAQYLAPDFSNGSATWGYRQWLLDPANPLVLIDAFLQGGNEAVAWQCNILMTDKNFHRLNVPLQHLLVPGDATTAALVARANVWLNSGGWFGQQGLTALARPIPLQRVMTAKKSRA